MITIRRLILGSTLAFAAFLATPSDAHAAESMRCQNRLISLGYTMLDVRSLCGPADQMDQRTELRTVQRRVRVPCAAGVCWTLVADQVEVTVEEWIYDFGKQRFQQFLTFESGRLIHMQTGPYGHKED
jgi:hypothetical protein